MEPISFQQDGTVCATSLLNDGRHSAALPWTRPIWGATSRLSIRIACSGPAGTAPDDRILRPPKSRQEKNMTGADPPRETISPGNAFLEESARGKTFISRNHNSIGWLEGSNRTQSAIMMRGDERVCPALVNCPTERELRCHQNAFNEPWNARGECPHRSTAGQNHALFENDEDFAPHPEQIALR